MNDERKQQMTKVPFNCYACGVDFQLYHDGITAQNFTVICKCGEQNHWTFHPKPKWPWRGIGFKADDSVFGQPLPPALRLDEFTCRDEDGDD